MMHFLWGTYFKAVEWFRMKNIVSSFHGNSNAGIVDDIIFMVSF